VTHFDFTTGVRTHYSPPATALAHTRLTGHDGADFYLMDNFVRAVATNNPSLVLTGPDDALASHLLVFEAEHARLTATKKQQPLK
jgi:hypothetical protein